MIMKGDNTVKNTMAFARSNTLIYSILTHKLLYKYINHITAWPQYDNTTWNPIAWYIVMEYFTEKF